jgi:hypothetical protein
MSLAEKNDDLREYLAALEDSPEEVAEYWLQSRVYRSYVPASSLEAETDFFCQDLEMLLELIKNEALRRRTRSAGELQDQDSSRPA